MPAIDLKKPDDQKSRAELTLDRIAKAWGPVAPGVRFSEALISFLNSRKSDNTFRSYTFAILEFFDWYHQKNKFIPLPSQVKSNDAVDYVKWLETRPHGLEGWRIEHDPQRVIDKIIFDFVAKNPETKIEAIWREVSRYASKPVDLRIVYERLKCMVQVKNLVRSPTYAEMRLGLQPVRGTNDPSRIGIDPDKQVDPASFKYSIPKIKAAAESTDRASTISSRLLALSAFWNHLIKTGENDPDYQPLLRFNHWAAPLKGFLPQAKSNAKITRVKHAPSRQLFEKLLATTYRKTHGEGALRAAQAKVLGIPVEESVRRSTFVDLRDRALLLLAVQMGLRASEICDLKRSDIQPSQSGGLPTLVVTGKGGRKRQVSITPTVLAALDRLDEKIRQIASHQYQYGKRDSRTASMIVKKGDEFFLRGDLPLLPAVIYWGKNKKLSKPQADDGFRMRITRQGIDAILRRRVLQANLGKKTDEYVRAHPHGLRRLFAVMSVESGTPLNKIQAMMGHQNLNTTGGYIDQHRAEDLIAEGYRPKLVPQPTAREEALERFVEPVRALPEPVRVSGPKFEEKPRVVRISKQQQEISEKLAKSSSKKETKKLLKQASELLISSVYAKETWGERGKSQKFVSSARVSEIVPSYKERAAALIKRTHAAYTKLGSTAELEQIDFDLSASRLNHVYIGRESGLLWWYGPSGKLKPEFPIIAPSQFGTCDADEQQDLCSALSKLWMEWVADDNPKDDPISNRGFPAASALVSWATQALGVSRQVETEALFRGATWHPFTVPLDVTDAKGKKGQDRTDLREHALSEIVSWFKDVAWQYRVTGGGGGLSEKKKSVKKTERKERGERKVDDSVYVPPDYYGVVDPVLEIPMPERNEMLDWLAALTGQNIWDRTPKFGTTYKVSRADIAELLTLLCAYDKAADELKKMMDQPPELRDSAGISVQKDAVNAGKDLVNRKVDLLTNGRAKDFDIYAYRSKRASARRGGVLKTSGEQAERVYRQESYLELVGELFGGEATNDAALVYAARCGDLPTASGEMKEFFRIDRSFGTIVHTTEFKRKFARESWTHSECVARRIARELWEGRKLRRKGSLVIDEKLTDISENIERLRQYRVPCPKYYERELRDYLGQPKEALPLYESWGRIFGTKLGAATKQKGEVEQSFEEQISEFEPDESEFAEELGYARNRKYVPNTGTYIPNKAALRMMPTPVALIFAMFS